MTTRIHSAKPQSDPPYFRSPEGTFPPSNTYQATLDRAQALCKGISDKLKAEADGRECEYYLQLRTYPKHDIGPVRAVYFREVILGHFYQECLSKDRYANTSYFVSQGKRRDQEEWLHQDVYLSAILRDLGVKWLPLEHAMLDGFWQALPSSFKQQHAVKPTAETLTSWHRAWTDVNWLNHPKGKVIAKTAINLYDLVRPYYTDEELETNELGRLLKHWLGSQPYQNRPLSTMAMCELRFVKERLSEAGWKDNLDPNFCMFSTVSKSPILTTVLRHLARSLWQNINYTCRCRNPGLKPIVHRRFVSDNLDEAKSEDVLPAAFWQVVADVLFHVPIVYGLPDPQRLSLAKSPPDNTLNPPPMWEGLTADACRKRYERNL